MAISARLPPLLRMLLNVRDQGYQETVILEWLTDFMFSMREPQYRLMIARGTGYERIDCVINPGSALVIEIL